VFPPVATLKSLLARRIAMLERQEFMVDRLADRLAGTADSYDAVLAFARELARVPRRGGCPWIEPDDLASIRAARPAEAADLFAGQPAPAELADRIAGAVHGRIAGCVLGKPFEMGLRLPEIRRYLEGAGAWPLDDFVPASSPTQERELRRDSLESTRGRVRFAQEDDDLNYLVLGVMVLERHGDGFTTGDLLRAWSESLPYGWTWGPEHLVHYRAASRLLDRDGPAPLPEGEEWLSFASLFNAWEEEIGAMIRADAWGLANPGRPGLAAAMAWRDAIMSHRRTGLYAALWTAATLAAATCTRDPVEAIRQGLVQVPEHSRFAVCVREALAWALEDDDWLASWRRIEDRWGSLGHAGTLNETAAIVNALVHARRTGGVDFTAAIATTVMQGYDTDSAGATAGSIAGALVGRRGIPARWIEPFGDTLHCCVAGWRTTSIEGLAARIAGVIPAIDAAAHKEVRV
jgi:hypothetical protein